MPGRVVGACAPRLRTTGTSYRGNRAPGQSLLPRAPRTGPPEDPAAPLFVISPDPSEISIFDERTFLSFRDRINLLRCGYVSAVQMFKTQFMRFAHALARHGISISLSKIDERLSMRMKQLALDAPGNSHRFVERRHKPRPLVVGTQNVHG